MAKAKSKPAGPPAGSADVRTPESDPGANMIGQVRLSEIRPSPLNPRKTFADESVAALADSIAQHGLLQPLVVRPMGAGKPAAFDGRAWKNLSHFELLAGERRFRALTLLAESDRLPSDRVPVTVRWLSDAEALSLMIVENEQREDVRPSEQAAGYARLLAESGSVEHVAKTVSQTVAFVRQMIRLTKLPPWALVAVDAGELKRETAALVARVPGERSRALAAACVLQGQHNPEWLVGTPEHPDLTGDNLNPLTFRETKELIRTHFQVELKGAPFDRKALYVLPGCEPGHERSMPPCEVCPSRAGNDPEATAEGVRGDVCLDPECYREKCEAHREKERVKFRRKYKLADGVDVNPDGAQLSFDRKTPVRGWLDWNGPVRESELNADGGFGEKKFEGMKVSELLLQCPIVSGCVPRLVFDHRDKPVHLVKTSEALKTLRAAGMLKEVEKPKGKAAAKGADADLNRIEPVPLVKYRVTLNDSLIAALRTLAAEFEAPADRDPADWYVREMAIHTVSKAVADIATSANISCVRVEEPKAEPPASAPAPEEGARLLDVPDFPWVARDHLWIAHRVDRVEQITAKLAEIKAERGRQNATVYDALKAFGLTPDTELYPAGDALMDHLDPITMPLDEPKPAKKAKVAK